VIAAIAFLAALTIFRHGRDCMNFQTGSDSLRRGRGSRRGGARAIVALPSRLM
jgi:hypothetical protein